jgi:hypothetical protein
MKVLYQYILYIPSWMYLRAVITAAPPEPGATCRGDRVLQPYRIVAAVVQVHVQGSHEKLGAGDEGEFNDPISLELCPDTA